MIVLSLFDGCGMAWQSLKNAGIEVTEGFSSEIDKSAIKVTSTNHPEIKHLGSVTDWKEWEIDWSSIDLVVGGSPCQGFSNAGKGENFEDPRSKLFFEFVKIKNFLLKKNPDAKFMLENVKMKTEWVDKISKHLLVDGFFIDSKHCSPLSRPRWYWANFPIDHPDANSVDFHSCIDESLNENLMSEGWHNWWEKNKDFQIKKSYSAIPQKGEKGITMTTRQYASWNGNFIETPSGKIRKPTKKELALLCGLPDDYFDSVSQRQAEILSGNGWDCRVTTQIFKELSA